MIKKITFALILFLINSCGYNSIIKNTNSDFSIISIEVQDQNRSSYKIRNTLSNYIGLSNKSKNFIIGIKSNIDNKVTSKDAKGDPKTLELVMTVSLSITENQKKYDKKFIKSFAYTTRTNKFDLKNYESSIEENLIDKISLEITNYIIEIS
jgi:hypothetical protein